jgi:Tol biopolymer transport system component
LRTTPSVSPGSREAKTLAALNHPNIAIVHGFEEVDGIRALMMELVEGPTLADRIAQGPVPIDEALPIARQIAEALEAAHEHGVVHRDLKPANIKLRPDGTVKVLDFGLAKAVEIQPSTGNLTNSPTLTGPIGLTGVGVLLGTAAYMSPEQVKGKATDRRADIWAFGCVLYEMLTVRSAFGGADASEIMAGILKSDVRWDALPKDTPAPIRHLIERCLRKEPKSRMRDIGDVRLTLDELLAKGVEDSASGISPAVSGSAWRRSLPWAVAMTAMVGATLTIWASWSRPTPAGLVARFSIDPGLDLSVMPDFGSSLALSPDGTLLTFAARPTAGGSSKLYLRRLDQVAITPLAGTEEGRNPFFSPDGRWIGFFAAGKLKKISVSGGAVATVADAPDDRGGAWTDDETIIISQGGPAQVLRQVSSEGGPPQTFATREDAISHRFPQILPGGRGVLFTAIVGETLSVIVQPLRAGPKKVLQRDAYYGRYVASGHLTYIRDRTLFAAPFDLTRLELTGRPGPIVEDLVADPSRGAQYSVSDNGSLVYLTGTDVPDDFVVQWLGRSGVTRPLLATPRGYGAFDFSPDGGRVAVDVLADQSVDVWVHDIARESMTRVTVDPREDRSPVWTPDGQRIAFQSRRHDGVTPNIYWQRADGTGTPQRLTESTNSQKPTSWHPDGRFLAFGEARVGTTNQDILILPVEGSEASGWKPGKPQVFLESPFNESEAAFSPDGKWLAYQSDESGSYEIYVRPFPGPGAKWPISTAGGAYPRWAAKGTELFYRAADQKLWVTTYSASGESFHADKPRVWSEATFAERIAPRVRNFAVHPDGRVAVLQSPARPDNIARGRVELVQNWTEELKRLVPTN